MNATKRTLEQAISDWFLNSPDWPFEIDVKKEVDDYMRDGTEFSREEIQSAIEAFKSEHDTIAGARVQLDHSDGQGHCWRNVDRDDLPANIVQEIECEIIDGGKESCDDYVASNGRHYRW